jgi:uncharacterized protein YunC (DUF1805 family)
MDSMTREDLMILAKEQGFTSYHSLNREDLHTILKYNPQRERCKTSIYMNLSREELLLIANHQGYVNYSSLNKYELISSKETITISQTNIVISM